MLDEATRRVLPFRISSAEPAARGGPHAYIEPPFLRQSRQCSAACALWTVVGDCLVLRRFSASPAQCRGQARYPTPYLSNRSGAKFSPSPGPVGTVISPLTGIGGLSNRRQVHGIYSTTSPFGTAATRCTWISGSK